MSRKHKIDIDNSYLPRPVWLMSHAKETISIAWHNMEGDAQAPFQALTRRLHPTADGVLPRGVNAFNTYSQIGHALISIGENVPQVCPALELAPLLPALSLTATWTPEGKLSLSLSGDASYPCAVAVSVARPVLTGSTPAPTTRFLYAGFLAAGQLGPEPTDAAELYANRFGVRSSGWQVGLRLVGVTAGGFTSPPEFVWADVRRGQDMACHAGT